MLEALLIEDEQSVRLATTQTLELAGYVVHAFSDAEKALPLINSEFAGILIVDVRLPGMSGLTLLDKVVTLDPALPVILVTGHGDISMAVTAMRTGAYDFIAKPFGAAQLLTVVKRAQEQRRLVIENRRLRAANLSHSGVPTLIGQSAAIERVRVLIQNLGPTQVDILINGQTGTGKEVIARQLHAASQRTGNFVAINCGALPESIFESEIFGHEAGAFTSAQKRRIGKLEHAKGGTVFLDEIESMPMALQVKLLRVLQERQLERLGGNQLVPIDCRIVAASKVNLLQLCAKGGFREDLYYRISVVSIDVPQLADRRDDIPMLLSHFAQLAAIRYQRPQPLWSPEALAEWKMREWPGNVRELRNFADRLVLGVEPVEPGQLPQAANFAPNTWELVQQVGSFERQVIVDAMVWAQGNVAAASERLGLPKKTLYDKLKKYRIVVEKTRDVPGA